METNLKTLLLDYYKFQLCERAVNRELEKMLDNPVPYNNGTDIDHLQKVLDYETEVEKLRYDMDHFYQVTRGIASSIATALEMIGVPPERKIAIDHDGPTKLNFWYDEYDVYYELAV
ncbi:MAG TPA: hypothetical protein VK671_01325 [Mucilaginibacter sp.]|jgi:hypothetical protein|nr:hypothetical protein [Mucilaginibacter sp.]